VGHISYYNHNNFSSEPQEGDSPVISILRKVLWIVATLRNAFVLLIGSIILFSSNNHCPFPEEIEAMNLTEPLAKNYSCITPTSIKAISLPPFKFPDVNITNTSGEKVEFMEIVGTLGSGLVIVPFVAILQSIGIGKSLAEKGNYPVNARNDFFAVGVGGLFSSFVASMPVSGCFSRSSLNFESNAATQAGNLITASVVLVSALCLAEYFK